ncbi:CCCH zinc finger protein [Talaromyces stipitatus ATCC 10500]|uniref:CCCH zinc finger protein n=1 Tax=Talaromyces stipitatus (strain ATCC 10500 / CBS 375.48 / QM 6759 / NRRL 1006) TaxID=441959 RepID=B8MDX7_TALSN|nr:CCCH zinc finger protein [Talaromyces stipitatus ATCC 10500]EED16054.1 CCCH zinc finger protein [Talaromyces stipitatus ATCC 10500]
MASQQGFSFPPPPPPPPPSTQQQFPQAGSHNPQNGYNYRGGSGRGGGFRGRGRGGMNRGGGGRGGAASFPSYRNNQQGIYNGGYTGIPQSYPPATQSFAAQTILTPPTYPPRNYDGRFQNTPNGSPTATIPSYTGHIQSHSTPVGSSAVVAPPMHWGYDTTGAGGFYPGSTTYQSPPTHGHPQNNNYQNKAGHKRAFSSAFEKPTSQAPRPTAAPAVPSFGVPLPAKPPQPTDTSRQAQKKKKRKFNQLGLTPKTEEHESSGEEEDDADEETRLAAAASNLAGPLQFTFRGRTSTLNNAADIQSWIEERKKRFPTQARIEEKKKAQEEVKKQRDLQREEARRKQQEIKEQREQARKEAQEKKQIGSDDPMDAAIRAKAKAEKLRKKLLKEERRLQKAEADAERARLVAEASQQLPLTTEDASRNGDAPLTREPPANTDPLDENISNISESSSEDEDSGDDVPEELSSRRQGPERVPPPQREGHKKRSKLCRDFQRKGKCPRGDHCRYLHDLSTIDGTDKSRPVPKPGGGAKQPAKRGLFQMLVEQEIKARDRQVMHAITWLGSRGMLDDPQPGTNNAADDTVSVI